MNDSRPDTVVPGPSEFADLAAGYSVVPVWRELPPLAVAPIDVFAAIGAGQGATLLENLAGRHGSERFSVIGLDPSTTLLVHGGAVSWTHGPPCPVPERASLPEVLRAVARQLRAPSMPDAPPLLAGGIGVLGGEAFHPRPDPASSTVEATPDSAVTFPRQLIVFEPGRVRLVAVTIVDPGRSPAAQYAEALDQLDRLAGALATVPAPSSRSPITVDARRGQEIAIDSEIADDAYQKLIEEALRRVRAGQPRQVTISRRFFAPVTVDPVAAYRALTALNPSPYPYLLRLPGVTLVGASPHGLVRVRGREVTTRVIAGTRPRGADPEADAALAAELSSDPKELDEHRMLIDLAEQDLATVAAPGSVRVTDREQLVRYARVMHLTTEVTGRLAPERDLLDAAAAVFPAGTVAGTPREPAVELITELEPRPRGLYGGAVGYVDFAGNLDLCLGIRALQVRSGVVYAQAGAGVVADSVPELEVRESRDKISALFLALAAAGQSPERA